MPILRIEPDDPALDGMQFTPYRYRPRPLRQAVQFLPHPNEPQSTISRQPDGIELKVERGDYLVNALGTPHHRWPVRKDIFEQSYRMLRPGYYFKHASVNLLPLTQFTGGDPGQKVIVASLEGDETVRAGDYFLARGVNKELWVVSKNSIGKTIVPENSLWGRLLCSWDQILNHLSIR